MGRQPFFLFPFLLSTSPHSYLLALQLSKSANTPQIPYVILFHTVVHDPSCIDRFTFLFIYSPVSLHNSRNSLLCISGCTFFCTSSLWRHVGYDDKCRATNRIAMKTFLNFIPATRQTLRPLLVLQQRAQAQVGLAGKWEWDSFRGL